ncbi:MAG: radical SAM protein [Clostridia bacterium]|nr:radical SAM protein [Clostridia bacterium]
MRSINIKTGFKCNNCCKFCIQEQPFYKKDKTTEEIKEILKTNSTDFKGLILTGGEVTIRDDVFEIVKFAKQCGYKTIQIQSNGRMFSYMDFCQRMIEAGATEFGISVNGSTEEMHDYLSQTEGSFNQTIQGICNLKKLDKSVCTNTVLTKTNYKDLGNIINMLTEMGVNGLRISFMQINDSIKNNSELIDELVPRYKDVKSYVEDAIKIANDKKNKITLGGFPLCTIKKEFHQNIVEECVPELFVYGEKELVDFKKMLESGVTRKEENCKHCQFNKDCIGPWLRYVQIFGFDEFIPIK